MVYWPRPIAITVTLLGLLACPYVSLRAADVETPPILSWLEKSTVIGGHNVLRLQAPPGKTFKTVVWRINGAIARQVIDHRRFTNTLLPCPLTDRPPAGTTEAVVSFNWDARDGIRSIDVNVEYAETPPDDKGAAKTPKQGAPLRGRVVNEEGQPVAGAIVSGEWDMSGTDGGVRAIVTAVTGPEGTFTIEGMPADAPVAALYARHRERATTTTTKAKAGQSEPVTLRISPAGTLAATGRVIGPDGKPMAGAIVTILYRTPYAGGNGSFGGPFRFDDGAEVRTGPDGSYQTPKELRPGDEYQAMVAAADAPPARTPFVRFGQGGKAAFPDAIPDRSPQP